MEKLTAVLKSTTPRKKRYFGIVAGAIILIIALGSGYYFRFKNNQSHFKKYGLEILDSYHNRIERQLNNEILDILSSYPEKEGNTLCRVGQTTKDSCLTITEITNRAIDGLLKQTNLENGFLGRPFNEFVVTIIADDQKKVKSETVKTKNSLFLGDKFEYAELLKKDSLNNGLVMNYEASGADYLLFGRRYQFEYPADDNYQCRIVLIGLVDGKAYNKATRELDPWVIALLLTFLLVSLFGLPFFKMIFITADERVFSRDIIGAGFSLVVGGALVIVIFMSLMQYGYKSNVTIKNELEKMGESISQRFKSENDKNVTRLFEAKLGNYKESKDLDSVKTKGFDPIKVKDSSLISHFKFIITIDDSGEIKKKINLIKRPDNFPTNIKKRQYVQDFEENTNIWTIDKNEENPEIKYVMRPVVSLESREEEAIYMMEDQIGAGHDSIEHKDHTYRIASAQLSSIHLPVIPFGFQYAIIDNSTNGDVWFHSQPGKSSLEEFFKVSRNADDLRAAIYARVKASGRLNYHGSNYLYYIRPVKGTNLNVVVLFDLALLRLQTSEVLSITAIAISLVFILVAIVFLFTVIIRGRRTRLYKEEQFIFDFLTPKDSYKSRYLLLVFSFAILIALLIAFGILLNFRLPSAFLGSLLAVVWSYILVYYVLFPHRQINLRFYSHNTLFLFAIVALNTIIWAVGAKKEAFFWALALQAVCLGLIILSQYVLDHEKPKKQSESETESETESAKSKKRRLRRGQLLLRYSSIKFPLSLARTYSLFLFSWFFAAAIVPTIIIYLKAEKFNEAIWIKTDHMVMSKAYLGKQQKLKTIIPPVHLDSLKENYASVYKKHLDKGKYIDTKYSLKNIALSGLRNHKDELADDNRFQKLLWSTRPIFNERIRRFKGMVYQTATDSSWSSTDALNGIELTTLNTYESGYKIVSKWPEKTTTPGIGEENPNENFNLLPVIWVFGIAIVLGLMYSMVYFYTNIFYGFRFDRLKPIDFDTNKKIDYTTKFGNLLSSKNSNSGVLLTGLPFSGKSSFGKKIIQACDNIGPGNAAHSQSNMAKTDGRTAQLSFLKLEESIKDEGIEVILNSLSKSPLFTKSNQKNDWETEKWQYTEYVLIENLEHGLNSFALNRIKLKVISYLIAHKKRLVITSEVYPNQILAVYKPLLESVTDQDENSFISDYNSWRNIFGAFPQILVGMTNQKKQIVKSFEGMKMKVQENVLKEISNELGYGQFLPKLAPIMLAKYADTGFDEQRMILHIQKLSHGYYTEIWNALPSRERYILYDLAKDGFMNIKNGNSLFALMKKGLIVWHNRPAVFNQSFQNFILSFVSKTEALKLEIRNKKDGSWGNIRIVMYLMIFTLVVFILLGEPGLLEDFEALLAALGGLGVVLPIISTILGKSGEK